jgi:hypothetical protein
MLVPFQPIYEVFGQGVVNVVDTLRSPNDALKMLRDTNSLASKVVEVIGHEDRRPVGLFANILDA